MSAINWERVRPLLERALDLDEAEAEAFIRKECEGEERDQVIELLRRERAATGFLASPDITTASMPAQDASAGQLIGSFRLVRRIGEGGMGSVWLAEREGDFRQQVAVKILRSDRLIDEYKRRFRRERSLLARLQHPGIARLIDGGVLPDGSSYLAMEYVEGVEIDKWVRDGNLDVRAILELFVAVCEAVQAAHQAGIVHRDLKPSNLLVTADGSPKLLDFGIAKLIGQDDAETLLVTQTGQRLLTPRYASPEQVRGDEITPGTDVFSLGVLLYELLTGQSPHGDRSGTWNELQDAILYEPTPRASTLVDRGRRTQLRGDLDIVLLRALAKEPARRYSSAAALADDLRRHMAGRPVQARPDSKLYRASKFVGRNRVFVSATAIVITALTLGLVVSRHNVVLAEEARARTNEALAEAELRGAIADAVNEFLTEDLLRGADPGHSLNADVSMRTVLDQAAARVEGRFPDAPLVEAAVRYAIGGTYLGLGLFAEALPHCREAYELRLKFAGPYAIETFEAGRDLARAFGNLGDIEGEVAFTEELIERMSAVLSRDDGYCMVLLGNLALAYAAAGRSDDCIALHMELLDLRKRAFGDLHENTLTTYGNLGAALMQAGRDEEALPYLETAVELRTELLGADHPSTLTSRGNLAVIQFKKGRLKEAAETYRDVYLGQVRVQGETHPKAIRTAHNLSVIAIVEGDGEEALRWARVAWTGHLARDAAEEEAGLTAARNVVQGLRMLERWDDAEAFLFELLERFRQPSVIREFELLLADVYSDAGREEDAELTRAAVGP